MVYADINYMETTLDIKYALPNLKDKPYGGASNVDNPVLLAFVADNFDAHARPDIKQFMNDYKSWACSAHTIHGIDQYNYLGYANGTTEVTKDG